MFQEQVTYTCTGDIINCHVHIHIGLSMNSTSSNQYGGPGCPHWRNKLRLEPHLLVTTVWPHEDSVSLTAYGQNTNVHMALVC